MYYKVLNGQAPSYLNHYIPQRSRIPNKRDHKYDHNFNCESHICSCGVEDETPVHFPHYTTQRTTLLSKISNIIDSEVTVFPMEHLYQILVYGRNVFNDVSNKLIMSEII